MRIAVCDDDMREQEKLVQALRGWDPTRNAECFTNGTALLEVAKNDPPFDIAFLDIYMPGENGVDLAKALGAVSPGTGIVFVTTSQEHAVDAFSLNALHYLVKPVTTEGIVEAFRRLTVLRTKHRERISITAGTDRHTVYLDQICLLESDDHFVNVSLSDGRRLRTLTPFGELERKLDKSFLRVNRGIVVNMDYITQMGKAVCVLRDGSRLPIAVRQSSAIHSTYDNYVFDRLSQRKEVGKRI